MTTRLNINVSDETAAFLRARSDAEGRTVTEVVRRMAGLYQCVTEQVETAEKQLQFVARDGSVTVVTLL